MGLEMWTNNKAKGTTIYYALYSDTMYFQKLSLETDNK